jgi:hypothetical protein
MAAKIDKVILTNFGALKRKYGDEGVTAIRAAVAKLIASDEKRGLKTRLIGVDDAVGMRSLSAKPVDRSYPQPIKDRLLPSLTAPSGRVPLARKPRACRSRPGWDGRRSA